MSLIQITPAPPDHQTRACCDTISTARFDANVCQGLPSEPAFEVGYQMSQKQKRQLGEPAVPVGWPWLFRLFGVPAWGQILVLFVIGVSAAAFFYWHSNEVRLARLEQKLDDLPKGLTGSLISQAAQAAQKGETNQALDATKAATAMIQVAKTSRAPATPQYFHQTLEGLNKIPAPPGDLSVTVAQAKISLAEYKSSLAPKPSLPPSSGTSLANLIPALPLNGTYLLIRTIDLPTGIVLRATERDTVALTGVPGKEMLAPPSRFFEKSKNVVQKLMIANATQTLDGIEWDSVTFVNVRIKYAGGTTRLKDVRFVNCTFEVPRDSSGNRIAEYAIVEPKEALTIGKPSPT